MKYSILVMLREKKDAPKDVADIDKLIIKDAVKNGIEVKEIYEVLGYDKSGTNKLMLKAILIAEVDESAIKQKIFVDFLAILEKYWVVDWYIPIRKLFDEKVGWITQSKKDMRSWRILMDDYNKAVKAYKESIRLNREALERYKKAGCKQYKWLSANDQRTCEECRKLHGKIFDIDDENAPLPPLHFGCRCTIVPVIDFNFKKKREVIG